MRSAVAPAGERPRAIVTLLRGPVLVLPDALATHGPTPPLGLAYVAAALRDAGHEVSLIDGAGEAMDQVVMVDSPVGPLEQIGLSIEEIVDRMPASTEVVGITTMFLHEWPTIRALAEKVKGRFPEAFVVLGGENATAFAPWIIEQSDAVDCCVLGEGEATMVEIADRLAVGASLDGLAGLARHDDEHGVVDSGLSIRLGRRELNDRIPRPAWDLVPLEAYWDHYPFFGVDRGRSMNVLGTRGCPYKCTFCSSPQMWTTKYVVREPEDVVDEIVEYVERFGIQNVNFVDLTAATNRKWTLGLCDALEARAPGVSWQLPVGTRIEAIDREVLQRLWDTNCRNVTFAPESGSERLLAIMDKRVKLDRVLEAVADGNHIGIRTMINILIGHPEERWSDLWRSVGFLLRAAWAGCSDIAVMMFCPYPGSADFDALVASGRHVIDEPAYYVGLSRGSSQHRSWNDHISAHQLRLMQLFMISVFYLASWLRRPWRAVAFLRAQLGGREDTYLDQMVRTKRKRLSRLSPRDARRRAVAEPVSAGG
jgi:radical SAM superfamily enzyme YgiQ (UPF0313 family)